VIFARTALATAALAFTLVTLLTEGVRRVAIRHHMVDNPRPDRLHARATPHLGGVAIVGGMLGAIAIAIAVVSYTNAPRTLAIVLASTAVAALGLVDDLRPLSPGIRLTIECAAAAALVKAGMHLTTFANVPLAGRWIDSAGTVAWIVIITNSFNLLDNMDGAAAAIAVGTMPALATLALATGRRDLAIVLIALCAGCTGFLVHNWTPARIFMGDAGSLFLGFLISASALLICTTHHVPGTLAAAVPCALLLITFVATLDTCTVVISRVRAGRRWNQGGTDHLSHRLRALGLGTSGTVVVLSAAAVVTSALGLLVLQGVVPTPAALAGTAAAGIAIVTVAQRSRVYQISPPASLPGPDGLAERARDPGSLSGALRPVTPARRTDDAALVRMAAAARRAVAVTGSRPGKK
jgi:UDP-GlcNAc:undecaprenyl-phosphate GlcNAc-1-phosphate transferase